MPEHIENSNMWNILPGEVLEEAVDDPTLEAYKIIGPATIRLQTFSGPDEMLVQGPGGVKIPFQGNDITKYIKTIPPEAVDNK